MAFVKKTWKDRISQYPNRRTINDGNVTKVVTVGRDEGTITQSGDAFNASNMNDLEQRIEDGITSSTPDLSNYYTKSETDALLGAKADASNTYTKTEVDTALALKANSADVYTKAETDALLNLKANYPTDTLTNTPIATFPDGADNVPLSALEVEIEPNLSGVSSVNVTRCGKNLVFKTIANCSIVTSGSLNPATGFEMQVAQVKQGVKYTLTSDELFVGGFFTSEPSMGSVSYNGSRVADQPRTFIAPISGYVAFRTQSGYATPQLEVGETSSDYEPYNGTTYPISLGGTYYGCTLDVKNKTLTVKYAQTDINTAINNRTTSYSNPVFYGSISGLKPQSNNSLIDSPFSVISGKLSASTFADTSSDNDFAINSANTGATIQVFLRCDTYSDVASLKTAYGNKKITYELATPTVITGLSDTDIRTLLGNNNIFADSGDIEKVTYRADVGLYIDKKIAEALNG